jgi:hypothetical protein
MPGGEQVVPTPPGLAANGLNQTLLKCALHKGGTRKVNERFELYFGLGVDVFSGKDNWAETLDTSKPPHETLNSVLAANGSAGNGAAGNGAAGNGASSDKPEYRRWKPENI